MMKQNKLRRLLADKQCTLGTRLNCSLPFFTEIIGSTGNYDYVEFMAEYAPFTNHDLENFVRAAELHDMASIIKIDFQNRVYVAQKAVMAGVQGILFTDCRTADDVRESIRAVTPATKSDDGWYGYLPSRHIGFQPRLVQMDHAQRVRDVVKIFMIEKKEAMDNIEAICSVPGVDMVQFGGNDYCMSLDWNLKDRQEERKAAESEMIRVALKHGVRPRCEVLTPEAAKHFSDQGVKDFCLGDQLTYLLNIYTKDGGAMRSIINAMP